MPAKRKGSTAKKGAGGKKKKIDTPTSEGKDV